MNAQLTFVHAFSPLHAGTGQGAGVIDLPIAREKATGLPFLPGSSLKGALRVLCPPDQRNSIFGPESSDIDPASNRASLVQFSDQRLLLLPMRSLAGTFAWVTSPYVLRRLLRDMEDAEVKPAAVAPTNTSTTEESAAGPTNTPKSANTPTDVPQIDEGQCLIAEKDSRITMDTNSVTKVYLEDLDLFAQPGKEATAWATWIGQQVFPDDKSWQQMLIERICIVHDDIFNFMLKTATEITARIRMNKNSKTVEEGGLWYEEALPTETILSGLVLVTPLNAVQKTVQDVFTTLSSLMGKTIQLGGKATVGRGMCRVQVGNGQKSGQLKKEQAPAGSEKQQEQAPVRKEQGGSSDANSNS